MAKRRRRAKAEGPSTEGVLTYVLPNEMMRGIGGFAEDARDHGMTIWVAMSGDRPIYQLVPWARASEAERAACIAVRPDEARRNWSDIHALARLDGITFGIVVGGEVAAVFGRHPSYVPETATEYRRQFEARRVVTREPTVNERLTVIESHLRELALNSQRKRRKTKAPIAPGEPSPDKSNVPAPLSGGTADADRGA